jgi:hypothetical protein
MIPLGLALRSAWGMQGVAIAVGLATLVIASGLMLAIAPRTLGIALLGVGRVALALGAASALAFGALSLALPPLSAAVVGVFIYAAIVLSMRSLGLQEAWTYVRGLH